MVTRHSFVVTMLDQAAFTKDPRFLVYKGLMEHIKRLTCLTSERRCEGCPVAGKCIYHRLTGENWTGYPALLVKRGLIGTRRFKAGESFDVDIHMVGNAAYVGYIEGFFSMLDVLTGFRVHARHISSETIKEEVAPGHPFTITTPVPHVDFRDQLAYYARQYGVTLTMTLPVEIEKERLIRDRTVYRIDRHTFKMEGMVGTMRIDAIDKRLLAIGLGSLNFLGGGSTDET
jgi:hypothetical protein